MLNFITRIPKPENNPEIEIKTCINRPRSHSDIYKHLEKNKKKISAYETSRKRKVEDESEQKIRNKNKIPRVDIASKTFTSTRDIDATIEQAGPTGSHELYTPVAGPDNYRSITPNHLPKTLVDQSETMAMAEFCDPRHELCHDESRKGLAKVERTVDKFGWNKGQPTRVENVNKNKFQPNKMSTKMKSDMKKPTENSNLITTRNIKDKKLKSAMKTWLDQKKTK